MATGSGDEDRAEKVQENRVRRMLARQDRTLHKCRPRDPCAIGYGYYHIAENGWIVCGGHTENGYDLSLDDCEAFAKGEAAERVVASRLLRDGTAKAA